MALGEKVTHFSDIASAQGETQKAISTALHTKMYQAMTDVDNVGQPGGAPSREAAIRLMSSSGEGAAWLRATPWCPLLRLNNEQLRNSLCFRFGVPMSHLRCDKLCRCHQKYDETRRLAGQAYHRQGQDHRAERAM